MTLADAYVFDAVRTPFGKIGGKLAGTRPDDLAGLTALLDRLDRASLAAQRRITVPFLREVLGASEMSS